MLNRYAAKCETCHATVAPGEGTIRKVGGKWLTAHTDDVVCTNAMLEPTPEPKPSRDENVPAPGYYAADYQGVLRFYRVVEGKGKWEGRTFLNRFRSDYQDRVGRDERVATYSAINADPEAAAKRFAAETVCCYRCGRRLTDAESRARGLGSECAGILGI